MIGSRFARFVFATLGTIPLLVGESAQCDEAGWEGYRNRLLPKSPPETVQDFGWSETRHAKGQMVGEIGGRVQRSLTPARYVLPLPKSLTLDDRLEASGRLAVTHSEGGSGVLFGWRNKRSQGWRTPNSLSMRVDGNGGSYWLFFEYGTRSGFTGGAGAFEGERYQTTKTKPFAANGEAHPWKLLYDPSANNGHGTITFTVDDRTYSVPLSPEHRADGAEFDEFGIWNQEATGDRVELWFDDLVVHGEPFRFDRDPVWSGHGNKEKHVERVVRPFHDFGDAGADKGIGGIVFRDERPAYFGDRIGSVTLNDRLSASGKIRFVRAAADSGVYIGWFDAKSKRENDRPEHEARQRNYLGVLLEGPSRVGHYFRAGYSTAQGNGGNAEEGPVLRPDGRVHDWSIDYDPRASAGRGEIVVALDGQKQRTVLAEGDRTRGATFDRFGLFNLQSGGWHVEVYLKDLVYTRGEVKK